MSTTRRATSNAQVRERLRFAAYLATISLAVIQLPGMIARGWWSGPGNLTHTIVTSLATPLGGLVALETLGAGALVGLLAVLLVDEKKRLQALLLTGAVVACLLAFTLIGFRLQLFSGGLMNHLALFALGIVGVVVASAGRTLQTVVDANRATNLEFRRAASILHAAITVAVLAMYLEAHLTYPSLDGALPEIILGVRPEWTAITLDTVATGGFLVTLTKFIEYDRESTLLVAGPKAVGKTYFMVGAFLEEGYAGSGTTRDVSRSLHQKVGTIQTRINQVGADRWHLGSTDTGDTELLSFTREAGSLLPANTTVESLDHAGENLAGLATVLEEDRLTVENLEPGDLPAASDVEDVQEMAARVENADTLVLLLDGEALFDAQPVADGGQSTAIRQTQASDATVQPTTSGAHGVAPAEFDQYAPLIEAYRDEKRIAFAITKADVLETEMWEDFRLNIYDRSNLDTFSGHIMQKLRDHPVVNVLLQEAGATRVYPVYFRTRETEAGDRIPDRPEGGGVLIPYGYTRLLEDLA